ncbi:alpha/beta fold hydrolase [Algirhabdus cladophorae]|uniref:alpha/beta fold hydrolase n=1 Tax=Algirhabdus cladophorae TaxID=3377108 RepID=UPI003B8469EA
MKVSFQDIDDIGAVLAGLDPAQRDQFWQWSKTQSSGQIHGQLFYGHPIERADFERVEEDVLFFKTPISADMRQKVERLTQQNDLRGRGYLDDSHVLLFMGWEKWFGQFIALPVAAVDAFISDLFSQADLTQADRVLLIELLVGLDLRQAALRTGRAYETKRSTLKVIAKKTNIPKQTDLIAFILSEFLTSISRLDQAPVADATILQTYQTQHLDPTVRVHKMVGASGQVHMILDFGPRAGSAVVFAAPLILPQFSERDFGFFEAANIRLLCPLRAGSLQPDTTFDTAADYTALCVEGLALASDMVSDARCNLFSLSNGGFFAQAFAEKHPDRLHSLTFASAMITAPQPTSLVEKFRAGIYSMATRRKNTLGLAIDFLLARTKTEERFKSLFLNVLGNDSAVERATVGEDFSDPHRLAAYHYFCQNSAGFLKADFFTSRPLDIDVLRNIKVPITFVHGDLNQADTLDQIGTFAKDIPTAKVVTLNGAGHILRGKHLHTALGIAATL